MKIPQEHLNHVANAIANLDWDLNKLLHDAEDANTPHDVAQANYDVGRLASQISVLEGVLATLNSFGE